MPKFLLLFLFLLLPAFHLVKKTVTFRAVVHHGNHTEIFNYLSNIRKFKVLNPTIIGITRWQQMNETHFYVEYTECLSQVPVVRNHAKAYYEVRQNVDGSHALVSEHSTCFFMDHLCLSTQSVLQIRQLSNSEVGYEEGISYSCPWVLTQFCFHEVAFQRSSITAKLKKLFSNREKLENIFPQKSLKYIYYRI